MRLVPAAVFLLALGCEGPPAPDGAVCRDFIHRVCIQPICPSVQALIPGAQSCAEQLETKAGCLTDEFQFSSPTRERFLSCRLALLRESPNVEAHPSCDDVAEMFTRCPDVVRMLQGIK